MTWGTRFGKPIVIQYRECEKCGRILRCQVTFQTPTPKPAPTPEIPKVVPIVEVTKVVAPAQETPKLEPPIIKKEEPRVEPKKEEPKISKEPDLREAETVEENLNQEPDEGPFSSKPDAPPPAPTVIQEQEEEEDEEELPKAQKEEPMVEGSCFLKESRGSIARRRKALAERRAKAIEALKKKGKATIQVEKKSKIEFLDDPDRPGKEEEYN